MNMDFGKTDIFDKNIPNLDHGKSISSTNISMYRD